MAYLDGLLESSSSASLLLTPSSLLLPVIAVPYTPGHQPFHSEKIKSRVCEICVLPARIHYGQWMKICAQAAISSDRLGAYDPELRAVLELATDSELYELETILFGPKLLQPFAQINPE